MGKKSTASGHNRRAEQARAALARVRQRERRRRFVMAGTGLAVLAAAVAVAAVVASRPPATSSRGTAAVPAAPATTATGRTTDPPWDAPGDTAAAVRAAGLTMLADEGNVEHIHAHLDVVVDGRKVPVPADIGVDDAAHQISPLHSHEPDGVLHIESPVKADFSLGQFFTQWQVALGADRIGALTAGDGRTLKAFVNGRPYSGDPAAIILHSHDEIALIYGTAAQQADPPATYAFGAGE